METLNVLGVDTIVFLQKSLPSWGNFFMQVSIIGDPSLAFTFYVPLAVAFSFQAGFALLWTLLICEWCNMILKWVLAGDRPFWWVHESPYYLHNSLPVIRQYQITCETGPGMPSGHSTLNAALFFVILKFLLDYLRVPLRNYLSEKKISLVNRFVWTLYGFWVVLVMLSRTYVAAHFPHQCISGVIIGILTAKLVIKYPHVFSIKTKIQAIFLTLFLLGSVFGVFGTYRILGNDPMWSVGKAIRWCVSRDFIHVDSKPFYALSRFSGVALGMGMALASSYHTNIYNAKYSMKMRLSLAVLALASGQAVGFIHRLLPSTLFGYYYIEFALNALYAYLILALLPTFVASASGVKGKPKAKVKFEKKN